MQLSAVPGRAALCKALNPKNQAVFVNLPASTVVSFTSTLPPMLATLVQTSPGADAALPPSQRSYRSADHLALSQSVK